MCGIFGELGARSTDAEREQRRAWLAAACAAVRTRGPDGDGAWSDETCALGHTRLAIIDLDERSAQPMVSTSRQSVVSFNGEIYNYIELRSQLPRHEWRTSGDSEVLLELLEELGTGAIASLVGMFAVAWYRPRDRELLLIRDRLGKKPLYYMMTSRGRFRFASDVAALLADESEPRVTTPDRVAEFLQHGYIADPRTGFATVFTVPAGHFARVKWVDGRAKVEIERYWALPAAPAPAGASSPGAEARWNEDFAATLADATRLRLRADVPLGAFLSGGIDSSVVSLLAARAQPDLHTYTIDFDEAALSEGRYAREVAESIGSIHTTSSVRSASVTVDDVTGVYSDLCGDSSAMPTMALCRAAHEHVTVALSGDGGDELLGGYTRYQRALHRMEKMANMPGLAVDIARRAAVRAIPYWMPGSNRISRLTTSLAAFYQSDVRAYGARAWPPLVRHAAPMYVDPVADALIRHRDREPLLRLMATDVDTYLPGDILVKVDRASMAAGVEVRSPFLDHRLFELSARARPSWLFQPGETKRPLRRLFAKHLPARVFSRKKMGFGVPLRSFLGKGQLARLRRDLFAPGAPLRDVLVKTEIDRMLLVHRTGVYDQSARLWYLLVLQRWAARWEPEVRAS